MTFIGIGDLVVDYFYDENEKLILKCGGKSFANIIFNLDYLGFKTKIIGVCGNDNDGEICLNTLGSVDTSLVQRLEGKTRRYNLYKDRLEKENWYHNSRIDANYVLDNISKDDILIFDSLTIKNMEIINSTSNTKLLDIGGVSSFKGISIEEIKMKYGDKFKIINMNERVSKYLISTLKITEDDIYNIFSPCLLIITHGKDGATFITNKKRLDKKISNPTKEVDTNGCGDMFFAVMIKHFMNGSFNIDDAFNEATSLTSKVVSYVGSRSYRN